MGWLDDSTRIEASAGVSPGWEALPALPPFVALESTPIMMYNFAKQLGAGAANTGPTAYLFAGGSFHV